MHAFLSQSSTQLPIAIPSIGKWFRYRRIEIGLSSAKAAALTGLSHHDWRMLEQGWLPGFDEPTLRSIAATLEVTFEALDCAIEPLRSHFAAGE